MPTWSTMSLAVQPWHWSLLWQRVQRWHQRRAVAACRSLPRYQPLTVTLFGQRIEVPDGPSFWSMHQDIFQREIYKFRCDTESPRIIDGGANIGLSVLYFRRLYPRARIVAFEADPGIFRVLQRNLATFAIEGVELVERALWSEDTELRFQREGADAGRLARTRDLGQAVVRTTTLRPYLQEPVDFLKLDIEGAETRVLESVADRLVQVRNLFVEYHSFTAEPQTLHVLLKVLADAGFRVQVQPVFYSPQPFLERGEALGMDLQLNLFAYRG